MVTDTPRILIAGGGASGVLLAVHLLRVNAQAAVTIVEKRPRLGAGVAYGTAHPAHLLNVRAAGMSAFPEDPDHFWHWAAGLDPEDVGRPGHAQDFAARRFYQRYLDALLDPYRQSGGTPRLSVVTGEALRAVPTDNGVAVHLDDGRVLEAERLVLATGNEGAPLPPAPWRRDGWTGEADAPDPQARILIVGAGLTMVDQVQSLLHAGHRGPIVALSRHGLTPHPHRPVTARAVPPEALPGGGGTATLLAAVRALVAQAAADGHDWRAVVDGLRPHTAALWQGLDLAAKRRFLRHARAYWDIHRHRIAPAAHQRLQAAQASGQLTVVAGKILHFEPTPDGVSVRYRPRGRFGERVLDAHVVYECRGRATRIVQTVNPLLRHLLDTGRVVPDETGLGLAVTEKLAAIEGSGRPSSFIYALGPLTAGVFWESTAVPDIRQQAARLAQTLWAP